MPYTDNGLRFSNAQSITKTAFSTLGYDLGARAEVASGQDLRVNLIPTGATPVGSAEGVTVNVRAFLSQQDTPKTVTFTNGTDVVNLTAHGIPNGTALIFVNSGGAMPTGLAENTIYYVIGATANTFQVALQPGGAAVLFTTDGTGTTTMLALNVEVGSSGRILGNSFVVSALTKPTVFKLQEKVGSIGARYLHLLYQVEGGTLSTPLIATTDLVLDAGDGRKFYPTSKTVIG